MRLNKFLATYTDLSRRKADDAIKAGRVLVNSQTPALGVLLAVGDSVLLDGVAVEAQQTASTVILLHKPAGFVCSKNGQGSRSVYSLLPDQYQQFNIAGRLDKNSSGLLVLTNDGDLLQNLAHPREGKSKTYEVTLNKKLQPADLLAVSSGVDIGDERPSKMSIKSTGAKTSDAKYTIVLQEGRNRQIRRTFEALGYYTKSLHRTSIGRYHLGKLRLKKHVVVL